MTVGQVEKLLDDSRAWMERASSNKAGLRKLAAKGQLGACILDWLRRLEGLDTQRILSKDFCVKFAWRIVAEGNQNLLRQWMLDEADHARHRHPTMFSRTLYHAYNLVGRFRRRRHDCFAGIVMAILQLSPPGGLEDAMQCFLDLWEDASQQGLAKRFPIAGCFKGLTKTVITNKNYTYDAMLYDRFLRTYKDVHRHQHRSIRAEFTSAWLELWHPTTPDPWPTFHATMQDLAASLLPSHLNATGTQLFRSAFILRLEGAFTEASRAEIGLRNHFPQVWYHRDRIISEYEKDPMLARLLHSGPSQQTQEERREQDQNGGNGGVAARKKYDARLDLMEIRRERKE